MKKRDYTDAEFEVIDPPQPPKRRAWFDWRNFLIVGALSLIPVLRRWLES